MKTNKRKIINDPVYGFININSELMFDLIEHPYFQRLRRIRQLGLTHLVYPGAMHSRFQHALGAMYLMDQAIASIRSKGHDITEEEAEAARIAILLHDIGHGPFSHALECSLIENLGHEDLSELLMSSLNKQYNNNLQLAIDIFKNRYHKKFLHQLVSGQLDMDRLDYLRRDSFFTGVTEGVVGSDRIIKMLNVVGDNLVVEAKGIYSIEKFLIARRLMYWQVYLHKTVLSAENILVNILQRAKTLSLSGENLFSSPALNFFLNLPRIKIGTGKPKDSDIAAILENFNLLDDSDIISAIKVWQTHPDRVLSLLCMRLNNRKLFRVELQNSPFSAERVNTLRTKAGLLFELYGNEPDYFVFSDSITNHAYVPADSNIGILYNDGRVVDISEASDILNTQVLSKVVKKYFLCYPKEIQ